MVDNSEMIFGVRAVIEAIQAGKEIDKILVKKDIQSDLSKDWKFGDPEDGMRSQRIFTFGLNMTL